METPKWFAAESMDPFELRLPSVGFLGRVVVKRELFEV